MRKHPFWGSYEIPTLKIPPQPHFESWLMSRKNSDEGRKKEKKDIRFLKHYNFEYYLLSKKTIEKLVQLIFLSLANSK